MRHLQPGGRKGGREGGRERRKCSRNGGGRGNEGREEEGTGCLEDRTQEEKRSFCESA